MHGSPRSPWDSKDLWKHYDYRDFGIIGEPYFDIDFSEVLYLTDTGRRWDGNKVSVRDKVLPNQQINKSTNQQLDEGKRKKEKGKSEERTPTAGMEPNKQINKSTNQQLTTTVREFQSQYHFRRTSDIIRAAETGQLPDKIMITVHPQRWTDKPLPWARELVWQNMKNQVKRLVIRGVRK